MRLPNRARARVGSYYEPSRYDRYTGRFHGTLGFDVRVFKLRWDFRLTGGADFAPNYYKAGLSFGLWH